jgi:hypothetical protein
MRGVALVELLVAMLLTLLVVTAVVALAVPARRTFQAQPEISDLHQRLRVAVDALTRDLRMAGAGVAPDAAPAVMPYRVGPREGDPDRGVFYRPGVVSMMYVPAADTIAVSRTYYLRPDLATGVLQLTRYDGILTDLPVVDGLAALELTYFDDGGAPLDPPLLQDGPWLPSDPDVGPFDMDLLRVRRVRARVRVAGARGVADHELQFDVALRNRDGT